MCGDIRGASQAVLQHVRHDVPQPGREDGGREEAPQALQQLPCPRFPCEVLWGAVPARGLGVAASRGVRRGAAAAGGCRDSGLSRGRATLQEGRYTLDANTSASDLLHIVPMMYNLVNCSSEGTRTRGRGLGGNEGVGSGGHKKNTTIQTITPHLALFRHVLVFRHCSMHWNTIQLTRARASAGKGREGWDQGGGGGGGHHNYSLADRTA
jgi:hypothetical protein